LAKGGKKFIKSFVIGIDLRNQTNKASESDDPEAFLFFQLKALSD